MSRSEPVKARTLRGIVVAAIACVIAACGGGGDGGNGGGGASVTLSGRVTFDRVPFKSAVGTGLDFAGITRSPAREVVVEAVQPGNVLGGEQILAATTTDATGHYSLQLPVNTTVLIRAKAQMRKAGAAPTWDFRVLNNSGGDALYALDGAAATTGTTNSVRDLHASSGWAADSYAGTRAAAPFAILDTMYRVKALILSVRADTAFPALDLFWSPANRASATFCPDNGDVVSSLYTVFAPGDTDECSTPAAGRSGIYILGSFTGGDTDEFDQHVIAHEAGHYFEDRFSRSDSIGGEHSLNQRLDLRVAFGEGWGNAFAAMVLNDPVYRDSQLGASSDFGFNVETGAPGIAGWFSEFSVSKVLWDLFDGANEPGVDDVALGFAPIHAVMTAAQPETGALTSLFPFVRALKAANAAAAPAIDGLLAGQGVAAAADDFGSGESNGGGSANALPLYTPIVLNGGARTVCGDTDAGHYNKLGNRRFLTLQLAAPALVSITASSPGGLPPADPDMVLWRRGEVIGFANSVGTQEVLPMSGQSPLALQPGVYVIEVYEYSHTDAALPQRGQTCINVAVTGA